MKKAIVLSLFAASSLLALNASATDILARVITSTPVVQQVAVPRQVCNSQQVITATPKSGGGALLGAVAGGAVGNAIGNGGGRALATVIGLVGGAMVGDRIEGTNNQVQNIQQCSTQTFYENRPSHYNVVYEYQGTQYNVQMAQDPGSYVRLQITPVGAIQPAVLPGFPTQPIEPSQPQTYYQQTPVQPGYVVQQPVFLAPVVVESYSSYYGRPSYRGYYPRHFYQPYDGPSGASINFGFSRSYGHR
jgi:uncharacterized protein YcfJ